MFEGLSGAPISSSSSPLMNPFQYVLPLLPVPRRDIEGTALSPAWVCAGFRDPPGEVSEKNLSASDGFAAVLENPHLRAGLNVYCGRLTYKAVADSLGLPFSPIEKAAA